MINKVVNTRMATLGLGIFGATFAAVFVADKLGDKNIPLVKEYTREAVGAGMAVVGTMLMRSPKTRFLGTSIGAVGVASVASGIVRRATGVQAPTLAAGAGAGLPNAGINPGFNPNLGGRGGTGFDYSLSVDGYRQSLVDGFTLTN